MNPRIWRRASVVVIIGLLAGIAGAVVACQPRPLDRAAATAWVAARHPAVSRLTGEALTGLPIGSYLLVDVRPAAEWSVSHLAGAFRSDDAGDIVAEARRRRLDRIIVYCSIGERSSRMAELLPERNPQLLVQDLAGGIFAWACEDRPMEDAHGRATRLVHPYDAWWGAMLPADRRAAAP